MQNVIIERVSQSDLVFEGDLIGQSEGSQPRVKIYRSKAGKYIAAVKADSERSVANVFDKPEDLVTWLKARLTPMNPEDQAAIETAAKNDETFKKFWTESVA